MPVRKRIDAIDFWRGLILVCIFIDHIPGNVLEHMTLRNFGFSDSAEAFVFLSGLSAVLAYCRRLETQGAQAGSVPILKRAAKIYAAHILLTFLGLALVGVAFAIAQTQVIEPDPGRDAILADPVHALPAVFALSHQVGYFNILPLYVILMLLAPIYMLAAIRNRSAMVFASVAIYIAARIFNISFPSWPIDGSWYFNPFCWQLMFALGISIGLAIRAEPIHFNRALFWSCVGYSVGSGLVVTDGLGLVPGLATSAGQYLDWDKTNLGLARLVDFLAHAYVICQLPIGGLLRRAPGFHHLTLLGRHSLLVFCVLTLVSILGQILKETWIDSGVFDIIFIGAGLTGMYWIVRYMEWQKSPRQPDGSAVLPGW